MKKLGAFLVGLGLVAGVASAANVNSVNMVGYQNVSLPANGLIMLALNWNNVGGASSIPINSLIGSAGLTAGIAFGDSDKLYVWDSSLNAGAGGYKFYYLWNGDGKWYDIADDALPTTNAITRGHGLWLKHIGAATNVTVAGEVPVGGTNVTIFAAGSLNMFGTSYTAPLEINGANQTWSGNPGIAFGDSDKLYVWDANMNAGAGGYKFYYLWNGDGKWYNIADDALPTTDFIPMGAGAWYKNIGPSVTTWTEVRPYTP